MSLPTNKIKKVLLPNNDEYEVIPSRLQNNGYEAGLPTLTKDVTLINNEIAKDTSIFNATLSYKTGSTTAGAQKSVRWYCDSINDGLSGITEPYDGMKIMVKVPRAGLSAVGAVLSINGNTDANYHPVAYNVNTVFTTQFPVNSYKVLVYDATATMAAYITAGTSATITGVWKCESDYDSNTNTQVRQYQEGTAARSGTQYPILTRYNTTDKAGSYDASYARYHTNTYIDTSTGNIYAPAFYKGSTEIKPITPDDPLNSQAKYSGSIIVISASDTASYETSSIAVVIQSWVASWLDLTTTTSITMNGITLSGATFVSLSDFITAAKLYPERSTGIWFSIGRRYASSGYISAVTIKPIDNVLLLGDRYHYGDITVITDASTTSTSWNCWPISPRRHHPTFQTASYVAGSSASGSQLSQRWYVNYLYTAAYPPAHGMQVTVKIPHLPSSSSIVTIFSLYGNTASYYYPVYWDTNKTVVTSSVVSTGQIITLIFDDTITSTIYLTAGTAKSVTGAWIVKHETALFKHNITCSQSGSTSIYLQIISADATPCSALSSISGTISKGISAKRMTNSGFSSVSGWLLSANYTVNGTTVYYLNTTGSATSVLVDQGYIISDTVIPL